MKKLFEKVKNKASNQKNIDEVLDIDIDIDEVIEEKDLIALKKDLVNAQNNLRKEHEKINLDREESTKIRQSVEEEESSLLLKQQKLESDIEKHKKSVKELKKKNIIGGVVGSFLIILFIIGSVVAANNKVIALESEIWRLEQEKNELVEENTMLISNNVTLEQELEKINVKETEVNSYEQINIQSLEDNMVVNETDLVITSNNEKECNDYIRALPQKSVEEFEEKENYFVDREISLADEYINVDPNTDTIFPGAIVNGETLYSDYYSLITLPRSSMYLSGNFASSNDLGTQILVNDVNIGSVRKAINSLVKKNIEEDTAANIDFTKYTINEEKDISSSIGVTGGYKVVEGKAKATFDFSGNKTNMIIKFKQSFFQIDAIPQKTPVEYFQAGSELSYLGKMAPAYISSVSYGRIGMLFLSSEASEEEVSAAVEATVSHVVNDVGGEIESKYEKVFDKTKINVVIVGGSSQNAIVAINGVDEFMSFIRDGARYSEKAYIVPIAYKLKFLSDNKVIDSVVVRDESIISKDSQVSLSLKDHFTSGTKFGFGDKNDYRVSLDVIGANTSIVEREDIEIEEDVIFKNGNQFLLNDVNSDSRLIITIKDKKGKILDTKLSNEAQDKLLIKNIPYGASELRVSLEGDSTSYDLSFTVNHTAIKKQN